MAKKKATKIGGTARPTRRTKMPKDGKRLVFRRDKKFENDLRLLGLRLAKEEEATLRADRIEHPMPRIRYPSPRIKCAA